MGKKDEGRLENAKRNKKNVPEGAAGVLIGGACVLRDGTEEGLNGHYVFLRGKGGLCFERSPVHSWP